ncbi:AAA family ATPase, partial [Candidatus Pacearchaeota archaeon]|nr:AAA family ATPase [Candidatus Pacearchaeota archaeon]
MGRKSFITLDGKSIKNLNQLYSALSEMDDNVFNHHVNENKNDFSNWLGYMRFPKASAGMKAIGSKDDAVNFLKSITDKEEDNKFSHSISLNHFTEIKDTVTEQQAKNKDVSETGIKEFDQILSGGIPRGWTILLSGNAGSGKTTLAMQWLYSGIKNEEPGLYLALTEPITKIIQNTSSFSFYEPSNTGCRVHLTDLRSSLRLLYLDNEKITQLDINKILKVIKELVIKTKAKRIVIDSITALCYLIEDRKLIRSFIFSLGNTLNQLKCTTFLTSEVTDGGFSVYGVEEFISDGIIKVSQNKEKDEIFRNLEIVKMRGVLYVPEIHKFRINKEGVKILSKIKPELSFASSM